MGKNVVTPLTSLIVGLSKILVHSPSFGSFEGPLRAPVSLISLRWKALGLPTIAGDPGASKERRFSGGMILENGSE